MDRRSLRGRAYRARRFRRSGDRDRRLRTSRRTGHVGARLETRHRRSLAHRFRDQQNGEMSRWLRWLFGAALVGAVVAVAAHFSEGREFLQLAKDARPIWLL